MTAYICPQQSDTIFVLRETVFFEHYYCVIRHVSRLKFLGLSENYLFFVAIKFF